MTDVIERLTKLSKVGFGYDITFEDREALKDAVAALSASPAGVVKPLEIVPTDRLERLIGTGNPTSEEAHDMAVEILNHRQAARIMSAIEPAGVGVETAAPQSHLNAPDFLHRLVENAFSWGKQDCNYLNPKHIDAFIVATKNGMTPEAAAAWVANSVRQPLPQPNVVGADELNQHAFALALQAYERKWSDMSSPTPTEEPDAGDGPLGYAIRAYMTALTPSPQPRASVPAALKGDEQ